MENTELPCNSAFSLLDIYVQDLKSVCQGLGTPVFIAAKVWKQPECPRTDRAHVVIYTVGYKLAGKSETLSQQCGWKRRASC